MEASLRSALAGFPFALAVVAQLERELTIAAPECDRGALIETAASVLGVTHSEIAEVWAAGEVAADAFLAALPPPPAAPELVRELAVEAPPRAPSPLQQVAAVLEAAATPRIKVEGAPPAPPPTSGWSAKASRRVKVTRPVTADFWSGTVGASSSSPVLTAEDAEEEAGVRVCRHFLAGVCLRRDCPFSHETRAMRCKFWEGVGGCSAGEGCPFLHVGPPGGGVHGGAGTGPEEDLAWALAQMREAGAGDGILEEEVPQVGDTAAFPSLASRPQALSHPTSSSSSPSSWNAGGVESGLAFRLASSALTAAFPGVRAADLHSALVRAEGALSVAVAAVSREAGVEPIRAALIGRIRASASASSSSGASQSPEGRRRAAIARAISTSLPTVSTGGSLSSLYAVARGEAEALARARNVALGRATRAYLSGDGATAGAWSKQGRELDGRMREAQAAAASSIFAARNAGGSGPSSTVLTVSSPSAGVHGLRVPFVDLHGLHPSEAASTATALCRAAAAGTNVCGDGAWLCLLTGARHHAAKLGRGGGSLHEAVREALEAAGWDTHARLPVPGVIIVRLG